MHSNKTSPVPLKERQRRMPKATNQPKSTAPKPPFSEDVMRLALARLALVAHHMQGNADDDDPVAILSGAIDELLHKRNAMAGVQQWAQQWLAENARR